MKISIAPPDDLVKLRNIEGRWVYADDDLEGFSRTQKTLQKSFPLLAPEAFQQAAVETQAPFVQWVDACMERMPSHYWLATPLSKNPFDSHLFLHAVCLVLIDRIAGQGGKEIIVITRSVGLALALAELCRQRGWDCSHYGKARQYLHHWRLNVIALAKWSGKLLMLSYKALLARRFFTQEYIKTRLAGIELLLEIYILKGDINDQGACNDRYFPGLMDYYRSKGVKAAYFPLFFRLPWRRLGDSYAAMARGAVPFAPFERFMTFPDMVYSAWTSLRYAIGFRLRGALLFQGVPMFALVRAENFVAGLRSVIPCVLAQVPRRMAQMGVRPQCFIDWFENQILDKGVTLGVRDGLPGCQHIAARQYILYGNALHFFSSTGEIRCGVAPSRNWVCGETILPIASRFDTLGSYSVVPALRYAYLHEIPTAREKRNALLVLLTHSMEESMNILRCVAPLCGIEGLGISRIIIKTHPNVALPGFREKVRQHFPLLETSTVEWASGKLMDLLPLAKVVVTSGSSAAVEAVCGGVPVALIGRQAGLDFNPLSGVDDRMWALVYDSERLSGVVECWVASECLSGDERLQIAEKNRRNFFQGKNEMAMAAFLPSAMGAQSSSPE